MTDATQRYEGEDRRHTSRRELWGWYSYGLAAEVFTVCGVGERATVSSDLMPSTDPTTGSFLPLTLEQLTREVGVLQSDKTKPCVAPPSSTLSSRSENQCIVELFGYDLNTSSFTLYSFSLAIVVQTLVLISIGAISDYGMKHTLSSTPYSDNHARQ